MKKFCFTIFLLFFGLLALSQNISVKSFKALPMDMTASSLNGKRIDQNGDVAALIKIVTTETGFTFEGGTLGIVDAKQETGEVWVWVPRAARKITIKHQKFGVLRDYRYPIEIEAERTYEMVLDITKKPDPDPEDQVRQQYLAFQISPPNATLEVNNEIWELDADGNAQDYVPFGTYEWRVQAPNYHPDAGRKVVDDPNNTQFVTVTLEPNFGWIEIAGTGNLQGASVYIDNALIGKAPCKSEALKSGPHTVRIAKKMYVTYSETVTVSDNETTSLTPTLEPDFANVTLKVDADAEIWVNNERKGTRTWTGPLGRGTYKIECKLANHETSEISKEITANMDGQTITLPAPTPFFGSLNVESTPKFCKLYIDGKDMGTSPKSINEILIGQHEIRLSKDGYVDHIETVTITKGNRAQVNATLNKTTNNTQQLAINQSSETSSSSNDLSDLTFKVRGVSFTMKFIEGGTFQMGATLEQGSEAESDEEPVHSVTLNDYYLGETEVTQTLWKAVMGTTVIQQREKAPNNTLPMKGEGVNYPIYYVSWNDCQAFLQKLNQKTKMNFRLPTEAEWEYAARGGKKSSGYKYAGSNSISDVAWYNDNSGNSTHPVKEKFPNELGLYDMSGNVEEWCQDWYDSYSSGSQTNPQGPSNKCEGLRVLRGGNWGVHDGYCRTSWRHSDEPNYRGRSHSSGFRIALSRTNDSSTIRIQHTSSNPPEGALLGEFSVSPTQKVYFSKGNLQYQASTNTWRFASEQWDIIGEDNNNISPTYSGWIDLFGWGTSGWNSGAVCYQPWSTSTSYRDYCPGGSYINNLTGNYANADWGVYNAIYNGGNAAGQWRTLTKDEWKYVFQSRSNASSKYGHGKVNGMCGMILLPDSWTLPTGLKFTAGNSSWANSYTTDQWAMMEANGAVFLPAAGSRYGTSVNYVGSYGNFWSASYYSSILAYRVYFDDGNLYTDGWNGRYDGRSVRLVCPAE